MNDAADKDLLSRLAGGDLAADGSDPWASVAAAEPDHDRTPEPAPPVDKEAKLEAMLERLHGLAGGQIARNASTSDSAEPDDAEHLANAFVPLEPTTLREADLTESSVEALVLKYLLARGNATGRDVADQVKLPFVLVNELLWRMKNDQLVVHRGAAPMNDYDYQPTEIGQERPGGTPHTAPTSAPPRLRCPITSPASTPSRSTSNTPRPTTSTARSTISCSTERCSIGSGRRSTRVGGSFFTVRRATGRRASRNG